MTKQVYIDPEITETRNLAMYAALQKHYSDCNLKKFTEFNMFMIGQVGSSDEFEVIPKEQPMSILRRWGKSNKVPVSLLQKYGDSVNTAISRTREAVMREPVAKIRVNISGSTISLVNGKRTLISTSNIEFFRRVLKRDRAGDARVAACVTLRYTYCGLLNGLSAAVDPGVYAGLRTCYKVDTEGFSSAGNAVLPYYCGLFPRLEGRYGCIGSFFKTPLRDRYVLNPPFDLALMNEMFSKIMRSPVTETGLVFCFVPLWGSDDRSSLDSELPVYDDKYTLTELKATAPSWVSYQWRKENFTFLAPCGKKIHYTPMELVAVGPRQMLPEREELHCLDLQMPDRCTGPVNLY